MSIVPLGPWQPDSKAVNAPITTLLVNARPAAQGFRPVGALASGTEALPDQCVGAGSAIASTGSGVTIAGTQTRLYRAQAGGTWLDVSRAVGGDYATPLGERWRFEQFTNVDTVGDLLIATNAFDVLQKFDLAGDPLTTQFEALGGTPPRCRYIATGFNGFLVAAHLLGTPDIPNRVQWSDVQNPEEWVTGSAGFQDITPGGPINAITSGEVIYIFQASRIVRMQFVGGALVMQFDEVESGRGLTSPNAFVEVGDRAYYLGQDGFYAFDKRAGRSIPIGANKINDFFFTDQRTGTRLQVYAGADPVNNLVFWPYISISNATEVPDAVMIYDWSLEGSGREWGRARISVTALVDFITTGIPIDDMNSFGPLDFLPFGLDSPFWSGGETILGVFGTDDRLSNLSGATLPATIETRTIVSPDTRSRLYLDKVRAVVDSNAATVGAAVRERQGDSITFGPQVDQELDGFCTIAQEGRYFGGRLQMPAGDTWSLAQGFDPIVEGAGEI